jgi:hypothetical protein
VGFRQSPNCALPNVWSWASVHVGVHVTPSSSFRVEMWARLGVNTGVVQQMFFLKFFGNELFSQMKIFLICKTQVRPSASGNRISVSWLINWFASNHNYCENPATLNRLQIQKMQKGIGKKRGKFKGCQVSTNSMSKSLHFKNRPPLIDRLWWWEVCSKRVRVRK